MSLIFGQELYIQQLTSPQGRRRIAWRFDFSLHVAAHHAEVRRGVERVDEFRLETLDPIADEIITVIHSDQKGVDAHAGSTGPRSNELGTNHRDC